MSNMPDPSVDNGLLRQDPKAYHTQSAQQRHHASRRSHASPFPSTQAPTVTSDGYSLYPSHDDPNIGDNENLHWHKSRILSSTGVDVG